MAVRAMRGNQQKYFFRSHNSQWIVISPLFPPQIESKLFSMPKSHFPLFPWSQMGDKKDIAERNYFLFVRAGVCHCLVQSGDHAKCHTALYAIRLCVLTVEINSMCTLNNTRLCRFEVHTHSTHERCTASESVGSCLCLYHISQIRNLFRHVMCDGLYKFLIYLMRMLSAARTAMRSIATFVFAVFIFSRSRHVFRSFVFLLRAAAVAVCMYHHQWWLFYFIIIWLTFFLSPIFLCAVVLNKETIKIQLFFSVHFRVVFCWQHRTWRWWLLCALLLRLWVELLFRQSTTTAVSEQQRGRGSSGNSQTINLI